MIGRFVDHGICIAVAAMLLLAVVSSPIRIHGGSHSSSSSNYIPRDYAKLKHVYLKPRKGFGGQHGMATLSFSVASALQPDIDDEMEADIEDELTVSSPLTSVSFDILTSPCLKPHSEQISPAVAPVARPLRC